ncbi:MAG: peptidase [Parcubacteria group bacterium]|nr:peptidase [Parcubacteria group bacterium]
MFYADSLGFLGKRGGPIVVEDGLELNLVHLTATPPVILESDEKVRPLTMEETLQKVEEFKNMISSQPRLRLVLNKADLKKTIADNKIAVVLGLQNAPTDVNPQALFEAGIRVMSLAYYEENDLGSGFLNGGIKLKNLGKKVIELCAKSGIIIDLSHVGHQTALDAISFIKEGRLAFRVMASHGGCVAEYHHMRNILNNTMRGIVELGGVVGITTITFNLDEWDNRAGSFLKHLSHAIKVCGGNNLVIGTDSVYVKRTVEEAKEGIKMLAPRLDKLGIQGIRHPENIYEGPLLMEKLYKALDPEGAFAPILFSANVMDGVFGQNLLNFFERSLPS